MYFSLHHFGGLYLDLDTITIKNVSFLGTNFAGPETPGPANTNVASEIMNFDPKTKIGSEIINKTME